ncbi:ABC transporter ATP-binding protein [Mogibacterium timidum]|uniref:ABC transporter ATP-binding protein n=1 Tax=Mogibacterium timidum TaxID=35519 RepID=A0A7Y8VS66_9FIRM|nr:ABC transporter ATP-binding protein [Mogibacterium timidum]NWO23651.1 ABC transporter ATP-binding protein [Mogibacterium timidum]
MITVFKKIWNFAEKEQSNIRKSIIVGFLCAAFNAMQMGGVYYVLVKIFDETLSVKDIAVVLGILLVSLVGKIITQYVSQLEQTHAGYFMAADKRIRIGNKLKKVPMGFFSEFSLGKITTMSTTTLSQIEMQVPMLLVLVLGGLLNTFVFALALFYLHIMVGITAVLGILAFFIVTYFMEKKSRENASEIGIAQTHLTKQVLETVQGMQVIKSYNLGGKNNKELSNAFEENCNITMKLEKTMTPYIALQRIVLGISIAAIIILSAKYYMEGNMILADAIMSMIAGFIIFEGIKAAGSSMAILRIAENSIDSLKYLEQIPEIKEGQETSPIRHPNIEFKDVSFAYDEKTILDHISCEMKKNTITAIVGPSGSGKTTFCNLIARFWDVNTGEILIGGKNIKEYTLPHLMSHIAMVFQSVYLFEDTIENNIKFGVPSATREEVIEAAKKAMCHDFIEALPNGYDTLIGEGGATLSGGEKQRISIARAMLKDAPIVIFDEATANIDPENEDKLKAAIEELTKNKTIIMIAHRLSTIRNADQILVLNNGKIEQRGNHEELMKQGGLYKTLINMKNKATVWKIAN